MVKHGRPVQHDLKNEYRQRRGSENNHGGELYAHGNDDLDWMKSESGGQVNVQSGVVDQIQSPQHGNGMKHDMLDINDKIKDRDPKQEFHPARQLIVV